MTLKTPKFWKKSDIFCRNVLGKYFDFIFKNFQPKFLDFGQKKSWFYKILKKKKKKKKEKNKKNLPKLKIWS